MRVTFQQQCGLVDPIDDPVGRNILLGTGEIGESGEEVGLVNDVTKNNGDVRSIYLF